MFSRFRKAAVPLKRRSGLSCRGVAAPSPVCRASLSVERQGPLKVTWSDGKVAQLHPNWLRERCQSEDTVDADTLQPKMNPHDLPEELQVEEAEMLLEDAQMQLRFSDGHVSRFSLGKLRAELEGFNDNPLQVPVYSRPQPRLWSASDYALPKFHHDDLMRDQGQKVAFLEELLTGGQVLVRGVPREEGEVVRFGQMFSTLCATDWGPCFNVRTKPDNAQKGGMGGPKLDLAYTPKPIGFHTDNPYRFPTPDFQLLHAIEHCSCPDGHAPCEGCSVMNYMVDGFYVAEKLRQEDPEAFDLLSTIPARFENNGGDNGSALVHVAPHFELEDDIQGSKRLRAIRFSAKSGQYAPPLSVEKLNAFYKARRRFSEMLHSGPDVLSLQLNPGDCLVFDNQRILHARSPIAPSDGERWVQGCYIDRDGLWLNYERWRRQVGSA